MYVEQFTDRDLARSMARREVEVNSPLSTWVAPSGSIRATSAT
jgi:RNase P/RNase MRP subunit p30